MKSSFFIKPYKLFYIVIFSLLLVSVFTITASAHEGIDEKDKGEYVEVNNTFENNPLYQAFFQDINISKVKIGTDTFTLEDIN